MQRGFFSPVTERSVVIAHSMTQMTAVLPREQYDYNMSDRVMIVLASYVDSPVGTPPKRKGIPSPKVSSTTASLMVEYRGVSIAARVVNAESPEHQVWLRLPKLPEEAQTAICVDDSNCAGPDNYEPPVAGKCVDYQCVCPEGWTGHKCHRKLECHWFSNETLLWDGASCAYDEALSSSTHFTCRCNVSGSLDMMVIAQNLNPKKPKPLVRFAPIDLSADVAALLAMWDHPTAAIVVFGLDAIWLFFVIISCCRSNESEIRKNARYCAWAIQTWPHSPGLRSATQRWEPHTCT